MVRGFALLTQRLKNIICAILVFFVGGVSSLTYFDAFLPGHESGRHPYHLTIFEEAAHHHNPLSPAVEKAAQSIEQWQLLRLKGSANFLMAHHHQQPGFVQFFQSGLSRGYLLLAAPVDVPSLAEPSGRIRELWLAGRSAWLPPPEKPPPALV